MDLLFSTKDIGALTRMGPRHFLKQCINASYAIIGSYMAYKLSNLILNNDSPISVVISESMLPGFEVGDIIFSKPASYFAGDMVVFQLYENTIPIVHRNIKNFGNKTLTKGDNNMIDDLSLYRPNQYYLEPDDIKSCVFAYIPFFGMMTIWINTIPAAKYIMFSIVGFSVLLTRE